jgi:hypothetical protein
MARRVKRKGAFRDNDAHEITAQIGALKSRMLAAVQIGLTHAEGQSLFTPAEHREILARAPMLSTCHDGYHMVESPWSFRYGDGPELDADLVLGLGFQTHKGVPAPLPPLHPARQRDVSPELVEKVNTWVQAFMEIQKKFILAAHVFTRLNQVCETPEQVRYLWPPVLSLIRAGCLSDLADKLTPFCAPATLPSLSPELREAIRDAAGTVTAAQLLDAKPLEREDPVELLLTGLFYFDTAAFGTLCWRA